MIFDWVGTCWKGLELCFRFVTVVTIVNGVYHANIIPLQALQAKLKQINNYNNKCNLIYNIFQCRPKEKSFFLNFIHVTKVIEI